MNSELSTLRSLTIYQTRASLPLENRASLPINLELAESRLEAEGFNEVVRQRRLLTSRHMEQFKICIV
jgi:hypothetical protein